MDGKIIIAAVLGFTIFLFSHIAALRYLQPERISKILVASITAGLLVDLISSAWLFRLDFLTISSFASALVYALLVLHYFIWIFGMAEAALRIRLLRELYEKSDQRATLEEIYKNYNCEAILQTRLDRLLGAGHLKFDGQFYRIKIPILLIQVRMLRFLKFLMGQSDEETVATDPVKK